MQVNSVFELIALVHHNATEGGRPLRKKIELLPF